MRCIARNRSAEETGALSSQAVGCACAYGVWLFGRERTCEGGSDEGCDVRMAWLLERPALKRALKRGPLKKKGEGVLLGAWAAQEGERDPRRRGSAYAENAAAFLPAMRPNV